LPCLCLWTITHFTIINFSSHYSAHGKIQILFCLDDHIFIPHNTNIVQYFLWYIYHHQEAAMEHWKTNVFHAFCMTLDWEVEAAQPIPWQRISTTPKHNCTRAEHLHDYAHDWLEQGLVPFIINPIIQSNIQRVILPLWISGVKDIPYSWELIPKLVKWHCHNPVCCVENFFNSISVMDIDLDIQNSLYILNITYQHTKEIHKSIC
jgi:hypothetical protein